MIETKTSELKTAIEVTTQQKEFREEQRQACFWHRVWDGDPRYYCVLGQTKVGEYKAQHLWAAKHSFLQHKESLQGWTLVETFNIVLSYYQIEMRSRNNTSLRVHNAFPLLPKIPKVTFFTDLLKRLKLTWRRFHSALAFS